jgi:hypothetical protein
MSLKIVPSLTAVSDRVVFAIYDPTKEKETLKAFQDRLLDL